jgi:sterol desaturase/sphingolipid hydroxylase (fatty acid hydroxylase superfamily)
MLKNVTKYLFIPISLPAFYFFAYILLEKGFSTSLSLLVSSTSLFILLYFVEKTIPYQEKWIESDKQEVNDFLHSIFGTGLGAFIGNSLVTIMVGSFIVSHLDVKEISLPTLIMQTIIVFIVSDFGRYIQHRLHHRFSFLWKFHELHHDVNKLSVFKTSRSHIVERVLQQIFMFTPTLLLGLHPQAILQFLIINSFWGLYCHSTADLRIGPFEYILMGPASHRVHHSNNHDQGNSNFGSALVLWDHVFRTFTNPHRITEKIDVGLSHNNQGPKRVMEQIFSPFITK